MCVCGQLVPLVFSIAKKLGCTNKGGVLAACFVIFDMLNTTESRLVLMDAQVGGESEAPPSPPPFLFHGLPPSRSLFRIECVRGDWLLLVDPSSGAS